MQTMPFLEICPFRVPGPKLIMEDPNKDCIVRREGRPIDFKINALHSWRGHF